MTTLEQVRTEPDWIAALHVALLRPEGVPERRTGEDPWTPPPVDRPRRISDDLAWFRDALDEPADHGLDPVGTSAALAAWKAREESEERLARLEARGVLDAAGFLLHDGELELS